MSFHDADHRFWRRHLLQQERLFWDGRPGWHLSLDRKALALATPGIIACTAVLLDASLSRVIWGNRLLAADDGTGAQLMWFAGIALAWCIFYVLSRSSEHIPMLTRYALTDRRVLISSRLPWVGLYTKHLTPMTAITEPASDPGTIYFDERLEKYGRNTLSFSMVTNLVAHEKKVGFFNIADARRVYDLMRKVMEGSA